MKLNELLPDNDSFERMADALEAIVNQRKPLAAPANDNKPKLLQVPDAVKSDLKERFQTTWFDDVDKTTTKEEIVQAYLALASFLCSWPNPAWVRACLSEISVCTLPLARIGTVGR